MSILAPHQPEPEPDVKYIIDGSYGEGGGRVFRDSLMYAAINAINGWHGVLTIYNIRLSRPKPGLKNSLIGMLDFINQLFTDLVIKGNVDGSLEVTIDFKDAKLIESEILTLNVDINQIGSAWLLFLAVHPVLQHLKRKYVCTIHGGTDVFFKRKGNKPSPSTTLTPPTIYMRDVWLPNINSLGGQGMDITVNIVRNHNDKKKHPYAIKIESTDKSQTELVIFGYRPKQDGCIILTTSTITGYVIGSCHPDPSYALATPSESTYCDEHFSDMIIPYIPLDHTLMDEESAVSEHHRSAIYVRRMMYQNLHAAFQPAV
jgi:RNA 3'-terminal phosphate cyclase